MVESKKLIAAIEEAAELWKDPDHLRRAEAVERTIDAPNRFTEEAMAFAINQQMHLLTSETLTMWIGGRQARATRAIGVLNAGNIPLGELQDWLAVVLAGHRYFGALSSKSPYLLKAFVDEVRRYAPGLPAKFGDARQIFGAADAVIATGSEETRKWVEVQCEAVGIPSARRLMRGHRYAVAVLDGKESSMERENLAEDTLLHEGFGCRNVALIWAPGGLSPDSYLAAFADFRGVFPVHPEMPGSLKMQQAFLEATKQPHAHGEGLAFLVSKGSPEVQSPGHVRWATYDAMAEVTGWLHEHREELQLIVARQETAARLGPDWPVALLGEAQRPPLDWRPDGKDTVAFLVEL